ncbi:MAG: hypothetical protein ACR2IV_19735, partial [Bryobacteraceae bacterium]
LASQPSWWDRRRRFLGGIFCFGFLLFSISLNTLPGYLSPLLPAMFVVVASQFEKSTVARVYRLWLFPCALLISIIPTLAQLLPEWLSFGRLSSLPTGSFMRPGPFYVVVPLVAVFVTRRSWAVVLLVLCTAFGGIYLKGVAYPVLDRRVSARSLWRDMEALPGTVCDAGVNREWQYGLGFYRGSLVPLCSTGKSDFVLRPQAHGPPSEERLNENTGVR